ncbi:MAG: LytTR family DNA-binding domain-containing protein [Bacteroidota bacterium]
MIRTILIDDEPYIRTAIRALLDDLDSELSLVGECGSVEEAVTVVRACEPDLVLLDIDLADGDAFDFLAQTEDLCFQVIFITGHDEYALRALKLGAVDYVLKPVDPEELQTAISKVTEADISTTSEQIEKVRAHLSQGRFVVSLQDGYKIIKLEDLMYCQSDKGYTTFYLVSGKQVVVSKPMKSFMDKLPESQFVRIHQSYCVNIDYLEGYDRNGFVVLTDGLQLPVSLRKRESFLTRLLNF